MIIKSFKQFESNGLDEFPSYEDFMSYFYDIIDDMDRKIDEFQLNYSFFLNRHKNTDVKYSDILKDKSNYIDILNTDLPSDRLKMYNDFLNLYSKNQLRGSVSNNKAFRYNNMDAISKGAKYYKTIVFCFDDFFFKKESLPKLIECLKRLYQDTNFRPYGELWIEGVYDGTEGGATFYGFSGLLVDCTDEEYRKFCDIFNEGREDTTNSLLTSHFL